MEKIWAAENKYGIWLRIEKLACEAYGTLGEIPAKSLKAIQKASFSLARMDELEKITHHDVIAFLTSVGETIGEDARFVHMGMTSSDILDTGLAVQLRDAATLILEGVDELMAEIKGKAFEHRNTLMIGRTHGVHAEPITFGLKMAVWYEETRRCRERLDRARETVSVGKISGAVGTYATLPPEVESYVCEKLALQPARISTQIVQRDRHAEFFAALAILASSLEKFALEIRHLQRTEVREVEEFFAEGQKGSSAMPHKRNPINSENLCGLARMVRSYALAALENIPLWHERDISHSSVERVIAPDSTILVDFMVHRMLGLVKNLRVYPDRMEANLGMTGGLFFSQELLLCLARKGMSREEAYRLVQGHAMDVWNGKGDLLSLVRADPLIGEVLDETEILDIFRIDRYTRHVNRIFNRVFGAEDAGESGQ
jgi:adenylosuccinate lyase